MLKPGGIAAIGGASLVALSLMLSPALAAPSQKSKKSRPSPSLSIGGFTPAVANPRLAAEFARRGFQTGTFRFTPSPASPDKSKAVKVAVRARSSTAASTAAAMAGRTPTETSATAITALTPTAYNLGAAIGWKRFALSGEVAKVEGGAIPGAREAAEVALSYSAKKFTGRVQVGAERSDGELQRIVPIESAYSLDVGASYSLTRNLDVTGGVRYRIQRDRLEPLADDRRDSQAVYIGTAFRF